MQRKSGKDVAYQPVLGSDWVTLQVAASKKHQVNNNVAKKGASSKASKVSKGKGAK